ncbi:hypothetical protein C1J03_15315 [Sulfitobacter sp. SK012]|uniref:DUF2235 domain-containing protein n=1 Tax=Sulfitobacter sp. SK012 TaxID=1389005 RepID=UPI000E0A8D3C|nr:DUF2235 domain-containing protein [Sulfitobacter sp. SK012]AXI47260.1 hypothetical protein C1J03_15315 [Sulfitobacter sp. SK012]
MARIAIFCDGTWNSPNTDPPTHVHALHALAANNDEQAARYILGVGAKERDGSWTAHLRHKFGGGIFGHGLNDNIKSAYKALAERYKPGDKIYIFGFSRGAYTARSLVGMLRKCGIVENPTPERLEQAYALYRLPGEGNHPDALRILGHRRALSPHMATSQDDLNWRMSHPVEGQPDQMQILKIAYLGVWDTVGSLGIPAPIFGPAAKLWNRKYSFHDTQLTSMVKSARHALALDERRVFYKPSIWDNIDQTVENEGLNKGDRTPLRPYQEVWFTGSHSIVGGSSNSRALSEVTREWVADGARLAGLDVAAGPVDPGARDILERPTFIYRVAGNWLKWRPGPGHPIELHETVSKRVKDQPGYRPKSLRKLLPELF